MDDQAATAYGLCMAVDQVLLEQPMKLCDEARREVAELLLSTLHDEDDLADDERARLHAALDRSLMDADADRLHDAEDVLAELRAR